MVIESGSGLDCAVGWYKTPEREKFGKFTTLRYSDKPTVAIARADFQPRGKTLAGTVADAATLVAMKVGLTYRQDVVGIMAHSKPHVLTVTTEQTSLGSVVASGRADFMISTQEEADILRAHVERGACILPGPGNLGDVIPDYYAFVFNPLVVQSMSGIAWWAVMIFAMVAGIELDIGAAWKHRRESTITTGLALGTHLLFGCEVAVGMMAFSGWIGDKAALWQFVVGVGMACAVNALPVLILLMEKLYVLRQPIDHRVLRYASLDDIAIRGVLAVILLDKHFITREIFTALLLMAVAAPC